MSQKFFVRQFIQAAIVGAGVTSAAVADVANPGWFNAVIDSSATTGMAPFAVHVHALNSTLNVGNGTTARFEWTFGDAGGEYNKLVGWNAAHVYSSPGTYTITLKVTNHNGEQKVASRTVTVTTPTRSTIYVSPTGSDSNSGLSENDPIQSFAKASTMLANNRAILFKRGGTYQTTATMTISQQNVVLGAYGSGAAPVIRYTSDATYAKIIDFNFSARDVIVENIRLESPFTPSNLIVRGMHPHGTNITVRNCQFDRLGYAFNTGGSGVNQLLLQNNVATSIGGYFCWGEGTDHVYLGNRVDGSVDEHNIRFGGVSRALIAHNDLTNAAKSCIWMMLGEYAYIANNTLREGRFIAGPNFATSAYGERFNWLVLENNRFTHQGVVLYSGAENMILRNNVITYHGGECFSVWGWLSTWSRTCKNITIVNNTGINDASQHGRFVKLGAGAENITVANNLYRAPSLNPLNAGNVVSDAGDLYLQSFRNNYWANPSSGGNVHSLAGSPKTASQWAGYSQTSNEQYRSFTASDLNSQFVPLFNARMCSAQSGVFTDFHGNPRPGGAWNAGAVEAAPVPTHDQCDINRDGVVNATDLIMLLNSWGACSGSNCPADVTQDGVVNVDDMLCVLNAWD